MPVRVALLRECCTITEDVGGDRDEKRGKAGRGVPPYRLFDPRCVRRAIAFRVTSVAVTLGRVVWCSRQFAFVFLDPTTDRHVTYDGVCAFCRVSSGHMLPLTIPQLFGCARGGRRSVFLCRQAWLWCASSCVRYVPAVMQFNPLFTYSLLDGWGKPQWSDRGIESPSTWPFLDVECLLGASRASRSGPMDGWYNHRCK